MFPLFIFKEEKGEFEFEVNSPLPFPPRRIFDFNKRGENDTIKRKVSEGINLYPSSNSK